MQAWSRQGEPCWKDVSGRLFWIQYFKCKTLEEIASVGVGCYISNFVYSVIQIKLRFKKKGVDYKDILNADFPQIFLNKCLNFKFFPNDDTINFIYDDKVWTLSVIAFLSRIESIDAVQHLTFFKELNQLIVQYQYNCKITFKENDVNTCFFWNEQMKCIEPQKPWLPQTQPTPEIIRQHNAMKADEQNSHQMKRKRSILTCDEFLLTLNNDETELQESEKYPKKVKFFDQTYYPLTHFQPSRLPISDNPVNDFKFIPPQTQFYKS